MSVGRDEEEARRFVEQTAMLFADLGVPRMSARVLMTLMASEERGLTAGGLAELLKVSPAAISGAVRYLAQLGLVGRESVPGSRSDLYVLPDDTWYTAAVTKQGMFTRIIAASERGTSALGGTDTRAGARIAEMRDFFDFAQQEMADVLDRWKAQRAQGLPAASRQG
ncbi:GbsR/MarR family transcriptional regulator [Streptomyces sp. NPDC020983]|uniref:GbsR/MarR family transcriptional regulator n=1 Tax=Streptomyces sp. NPDC020983 TaxID=3365106 RepID=UPI0037A1C241